jgi:hypothetical protein
MVEVDVPVVAENHEQAEAVALKHAREEMDNLGFDAATAMATEFRTPDEFEGQGLPYGVADGHERRNWSMNKWVEAAVKPAEKKDA